MKTDVLNRLSRSVHKFGFQIKKHSPEILLVTGVVGTVTATVMACKATTKAGDILNKAKEQIEGIHTCQNDPLYAEEYTKEDAQKDLAIVYTKTAVDYIKLYGPAVLVGAASIGCILASHNIVNKRNAALTAAYAVIERNFKDYRGRVVDRFGEELDRELRYNIKAKEVEETVVNEDGTTSTVTKTVQTADFDIDSDYARFFDDGCVGWTKDPEMNLVFLKHQQRVATDRLQSEGILFLNDVYEMLGIPKTRAGQVVGWIYDEKEPIGDNYVDFGIYDVRDERKRAFVNGYERNILLEFNVDGNVWKLMK